MKKITALVLATVMMMSMVLTGCGGSGSSAQPSGDGKQDSGKTYTFKMANSVPDTDPIGAAMKYLGEELEKRSEGRIKAEVYYNGELTGNNSEQLQMVMDGSLHLTAIPGSNISGMSPELKQFNICDYPFLFETLDNVNAFWDSDLAQEMYDKAHDTLGVYVVGGYAIGQFVVSSKVGSIRVPADIAGQKIRVNPNELLFAVYDAWGAAPTPIEYGEMYTALQQNAVEGVNLTPGLYVTSRLDEVQKYMALTNHIISSHYGVVNAEWVDSLPDDLKAIVEECLADYIQKARELEYEAGEAAVGQLRDLGMEVNELTAEEVQIWKDASAEVITAFGDVAGAEFVAEVQEFVAGL